MDSPGEKKGQRRGSCGHVMAAFDLHKKCARCRDKGIGDDPCVKDKQCSVCDSFSDEQKELISTPSYRIRKDRKAGILVSPKEVEVIASVDSSAEPTFTAPPQSTSHPATFVTAEQFSLMNDKWAEQFARVEALLSRGNVFSTPKMAVNPSSLKAVPSESPFIAPAARPTGPVESPAVQEAVVKSGEDKPKKTKDKKHKKSVKIADKPVPLDKPVPALGTSGPESVTQATVQKKAPPASSVTLTPEDDQAGSAGDLFLAKPTTSSSASAFPGTFNLPPEPDDIDFDDPLAGSDVSSVHSDSDEGEISSDTLEHPEQTEEMNYRETVRSVRSFMGWTHIPDFESDLNEPDKSNNPWKGKNPKRPARISVEMPPDDWLCQKLERLNTVVAEGYPSRAQDSAGLKKDQFVKIPKSQARWYQMYTIKQDGPHRPGRKLFSWHNTEAKLNSQFPRLTKASAYPAAGPPSRPISQEYLRRWEKCARENSYIVNNAAGFNRCASELQDKMSSNVAMLCSRINKGKAPKEVSGALNDLKDLMAFHQSVSVAMGTALQHLADSVFVHLANLILIRRDAYLEHMKPGVKQDTWLHLRNAPMFGYGLFPDAVIATAEQDIIKHEASGSALRPGPGASQQSGWRTANRYRPYDRRDQRSTGTEQEQQPWRQFSRPRNRGRGRGRGSNPRFSRSKGYKGFK